MPKNNRLPRPLRQLLAALTHEDKLRKFRYAHERDPRDDEELNAFILSVARELYNAEFEGWPENDEELS